MGFGSIFFFFFLIYASIQSFPKRGQAVFMGIANSIGMLAWIVANLSIQYLKELFGIEVVSCMALVIMIYMGMTIHSLFKKQTKNKVQLSNAFILVLKDKISWCFAFVSLGFYSATFIFGTTWGNSFLMEVYGLSAEIIGSISQLVFWGLGIGAPLIGYLSDRFLQRKVFILALNFTALISIGAILYFSPMPIYLLGALSFITGVCSSGYLLLYTLFIDYNHPKVQAATAIFISSIVFVGSIIIESQFEFPFLFVLLAITGIFALRLKDSPPEMEESKEKLEKLLAAGERISNS
jgi:predicted MFS family arabinose efflux permease